MSILTRASVDIFQDKEAKREKFHFWEFVVISTLEIDEIEPHLKLETIQSFSFIDVKSNKVIKLCKFFENKELWRFER